jgi:hypothetical protein
VRRLRVFNVEREIPAGFTNTDAQGDADEKTQNKALIWQSLAR